MNIFLANTSVTLVIPLVDRDGNQVTATAAEYRVVSGDGTELVSKIAVPGFVAGNAATVTVSALLNQMSAINPTAVTSAEVGAVSVRQTRTVELYILVSGNAVVVSKSYAIEPVNTLITGLNSFQSLAEAEATAIEVVNIRGWDEASSNARVAALMEARLNICQLQFSITGISQSNVSYSANQQISVSVGELTPVQYSALPATFRAALQRAQVAQADFILGGDASDSLRQEGITLDVTGESRQAFRQTKPLDLPVSKRALRYLSSYVSFSKRIGRT